MDFVIHRGQKIHTNFFSIDLSGRNIRDISEIQGLDKLENPININLSSNKISEIKGLDDIPNLQGVNLSNNMIKEIKGFENIRKLSNLELSNNQITEIKGLDDTQIVMKLDLGSNQISEIKGLDHLNQLIMLFLGFNRIREIQGLDNLTNLKALVLSGNKISEIKGLGNLKSLNTLSLKHNQINSAIIQDFGGFTEGKNQVKQPQRFVAYCQQRDPPTKKEYTHFKATTDVSMDAKLNTSNTPFPAYDYVNNGNNFVFASYAHIDKNEVYPIFNFLHQKGINIWYDEGIPLSTEWRAKIADALRNCRVFIVFLTPKSINRPNVIREINFSLNRYDRGELKIIPIFLQKTALSDELNFSLGGIQSIMKFKMNQKSFNTKLFQQIQRMM